LRFARTRHGNSDIDRAARQQQVVFAIRERVLNLNLLPELIIHAPSLLDNFKDNVYTHLSVDQMIQLAWYIKDIPRENITTGVIGYGYVQNGTGPNGAQVLIPYQARLGELLTQVFGANYGQ